jgi:NitT/TauT family transport system substrate-binding protein
MAIPRRTATAGTRARLSRVTLCALAALLVAQLGGSAAAAPRNGEQLREIRIALIAIDGTAQAMYALDKGFFRKHGIDAEVMLVADGTAVQTAMASGAAQFSAVPAANLARLKSLNVPYRAVAAGSLYDPRVPTTALVAAPGKRIRRPRDLVGKRVIVDFPNSIAHFSLLRWLKRGGVEREQVKISTFAFGQALGPLLRGEAAAAVLPEPWVTIALGKGARRAALPFDAVCTAECLVTTWMARTNADAGLVARFRNAIQAASVWANQKKNQAESARILAKYTKQKPALLAKAERVRYATRLRPAMAQPWLDLFVEYKMLPDSFKAADLVK